MVASVSAVAHSRKDNTGLPHGEERLAHFPAILWTKGFAVV
jgi:hypothetical protein